MLESASRSERNKSPISYERFYILQNYTGYAISETQKGMTNNARNKDIPNQTVDLNRKLFKTASFRKNMKVLHMEQENSNLNALEVFPKKNPLLSLQAEG